ncbi:D-alanyl-D-alanine carboxypeptidase [Streptomyces sp. MnatMP-M77]|uniref:serine hydrolase n=1 Tax=unclassified Streptomyces TaxID=2593676 RepID=UPI000804BCDF|nr:serine hydrolase [Streptomyces sp. MnatMP-M77]MYT81006.1 D-alanyl-D-alanine carboxypeptidase [Streptomyces sp. SID8364]SBV08105.1 D-alanyl-D-alanine carboxypeptidase [Streptomyces sp. MnatMP-M77]
MAGESPDKTEQRKSSGTAAEERDPRFAVFRDPGADTDADTDADVDPDAGGSADTEASADPGPTSDTATAVFRPRLPEDAARREPEATSPTAPTAAGEPESGSEPAEESAAEPNADSGAGSGSDGGPASGSEADAETAAEPEGVPLAASTASGKADAPSEGSGAAEGGTSRDAGSEASDAEAAAEPGDGRLRAAVAAWVDAEAEDEPAADAEADTDADTDTEADSVAEPVSAAEDEPSAAAEPDATPKPEAAGDAADAKPKPDTKPGADARPEVVGDAADAKPEPDAKPEAGTKPGADAKPEAGTKPESEPEPESEDEPDDQPKAAPTPIVTPTAAPESQDAPKAGSQAEPKAGAEPDRASDADADDPRGIDQPTAIFKAVKPDDRVDQATTALKLPPREDWPAAKPGSKPEAGPESDAERTSTFVPLRSDDVRSAPAPRKPESGAGAATEAGTAAESPVRTPETASQPPAAPSWAAAERTRQQPLPPRPPLDLLAELTNTPPPPETPVRTAVRRVKIWTPLVLLLLIVFAIVQVMRPLPEPSLQLTAKPTYTFEGGETKLSWPGQGQSAVMVDGVGSLGSEGAQKPAPIASVAKVMTAHVILQEHPLKGDEEGETITVDQKAEDESQRPDESTAPLTKGQKLTQRQMLQLLMIPSGNNAARLLARWDAGSEDAFIDKMNDAAKDLGMTGSTYTDPSGLEKTTVSTATDQLKLAQAVMRNEVFRKIVDMPEVEIKGIDGKIYNNNNLLLQPGVSGIKTGSSTPAGGNLLWSANTKVDGKLLWIYGAVMGQQAGTGRVYDSLELSLQNSLKLIKDAQKAATSATVVKKGDVVGYVDNGFGGQTPVVATKNLKAVGWSGLEVELKVTDNGKGIDHAAKAGAEVGMVTVGTGTGKVTAPVVLQSDLTEPAFGDKLTRIG